MISNKGHSSPRTPNLHLPETGFSSDSLPLPRVHLQAIWSSPFLDLEVLAGHVKADSGMRGGRRGLTSDVKASSNDSIDKRFTLHTTMNCSAYQREKASFKPPLLSRNTPFNRFFLGFPTENIVDQFSLLLRGKIILPIVGLGTDIGVL